MEALSGSQVRKPYYLPPEKVRKDNTNLYRYSTKLDKALRKDRFRKAQPHKFAEYCAAANLNGTEDPFPELEFNMDVEKFMSLLSDRDSQILRLHLFKLNQTEIADVLGISQTAVCFSLRDIRGWFADFYKD